MNNKQPRGRPLSHSHSRADCAWWLGTRHGLSLTSPALSLIYGSCSATLVFIRPRHLSQLLWNAQAASHALYQQDRVSLEWLTTYVQCGGLTVVHARSALEPD